MATKTTRSEEKNKGGRKVVLTLEIAHKIIKLIEQMRRRGVQITWDNIVLHTNKQLGVSLQRNVLSQTTWNGRKLISEAFKEAKDMQRATAGQLTPKYANSSRARLHKRIEELDAQVLVLGRELEQARQVQLTALDLFRATQLDLRDLVDEARGKPPPSASGSGSSMR